MSYWMVGNTDVFADLHEGEIFEVQDLQEAGSYPSLCRISSGQCYTFDSGFVGGDYAGIRVSEASNVVRLINDVLFSSGVVLGDPVYIDAGGNELDEDKDGSWLDETATIRFRVEKV